MGKTVDRLLGAASSVRPPAEERPVLPEAPGGTARASAPAVPADAEEATPTGNPPALADDGALERPPPEGLSLPETADDADAADASSKEGDVGTTPPAFVVRGLLDQPAEAATQSDGARLAASTQAADDGEHSEPEAALHLEGSALLLELPTGPALLDGLALDVDQTGLTLTKGGEPMWALTWEETGPVRVGRRTRLPDGETAALLERTGAGTWRRLLVPTDDPAALAERLRAVAGKHADLIAKPQRELHPIISVTASALVAAGVTYLLLAAGHVVR